MKVKTKAKMAIVCSYCGDNFSQKYEMIATFERLRIGSFLARIIVRN